jgi:FtsP/CotA-like multicopper oxidase with cupredoxin domain
MKKLALLTLLLMLGGLAFGQVPTCNSWSALPPDPTAVPVYSASNTSPDPAGTPYCTDFFGVANYANSPLPVGPVDTTNFTFVSGGSGYTAPIVTITDFYGMTTNVLTCTATFTGGLISAISGCVATTGTNDGFMAPVVNVADSTGSGAMILAKLAGATSGGIPKFVDTLPDLKGTIATADKTTFAAGPPSDYYEIALVDTTLQMHTNLPPTRVRGYVQVPTGAGFLGGSAACSAAAGVPFNYLGPVIVAAKGRPVRVKFINCLPSVAAGGNLFIPADPTYMGAGVGPDGVSPYLENRATLHLHGGNTPWISDGTPHQWTVPAADFGTTYNRGVSTRFVPDMWFDANNNYPLIASCAGQTTCAAAGATNDPGPGSMTFFWTNEQGGRLMFYHDHAYGITRLNVYAGEAAGYLLADPVEEDALAAATAPGTVGVLVGGTSADPSHLIPLVIQDKTFVPSAAQLAAEDPTWVATPGGGTAPGTPTAPGTANMGDLWFNHVYPPNQNPNDNTGANAFGRWDYGAWFFPPQTTLSAAKPNPTDITIPCTSAAYPGQLLQATIANPVGGCPIIPNPSGTPEGFMDTPLVNGKAYPVLHVAPEAYRFRILSVGNDRALHLSLYQACSNGVYTAAATNCAAAIAAGVGDKEVPMVPAVRGGLGTSGYIYPDQLDGRDGGVPDSTAAGPPWYQIGTEGGLLPNLAVIPPTPVGFEYNRKSITVLNVSTHGLLLGPAERADVVVNFSGYANGTTFIMYNDAPAPIPAFDPRIDYFTGDMDQVQNGGAPTTLPGYGPNTRTIMKIVVDQPASGQPTFNPTTLQTALPGIFNTATAPVPAIVPEPTYPAASGGNSATAIYARIQDNTISFTPISPISAAPCTTPTYPDVLMPAGTPACVNMDQKAIQELFTLDYGRMNATLGTELPLTNFLVQTTLPFGYAEWATEIIQDGHTQLWKLTHNGVDTHFIHFHLFNVQVINRIGWDGMVKPPDPNELGWKDTVRMNPLEDIVVALQPYSQSLPWPLPDSIRSLDVTMRDGMNPDPIISGIDPATGNAILAPFDPGFLGTAGTMNEPVNFGWEYVWHCHILGHEENDMMRPIIFQVPPPAPTNLVASGTSDNAVLTWTDNSASETRFTLERSTITAFSTADPGYMSFTVPPSAPNTAFGGIITFTDTTGIANTAYYYRVQAQDDFTPNSPLAPNPPLTARFQTVPLFSAWSNVASLSTAQIAPTVTLTGAPASAPYLSTFTVTATTNANVMPTITPTGTCTVGAVTGTPASASALVTMTSGTGSCVLTANWPAATFFLAATATQTTTAAPATPIVSFTGAPASAPYLGTFIVTATTNTGDATTFPSITGTAGVCTVGTVGGTFQTAIATVTMNTGTGSCVLSANWAATTNYVAAGPLTQSTLATQIAPTVTFSGAPASAVYNTTFTVATTTNSTSVAVITASGACSIAGTLVTMTSGTGTCSLTANWAADPNYLAATATQSTAAVKATSTTATSTPTPNPSVVGQGVSVSYTVTGGGVAPTGTVTVTATTGESCTATLPAASCSLTFATTGTRTMTASYSGDANYNPSTSAASATQNVLDFVLGIKPGAQNVNGGQKASYTLTATAIGGVAMPINLSCTTNQPTYTCTVSPTSVTPNGGTKNATVTVFTVKGSPGTWTLTVTGTDTQTGFTLTHTVTATVSVKN